MISIYIAHAFGYIVDPLFTGCCSSCRDDGIPFEHLAPCLWPRRLLRQGNISACWSAKDLVCIRDLSCGLCQTYTYTHHAAHRSGQSI